MALLDSNDLALLRTFETTQKSGILGHLTGTWVLMNRNAELQAAAQLGIGQFYGRLIESYEPYDCCLGEVPQGPKAAVC